MTTTTTTTTADKKPMIVYHIPATKLVPNSPHPLLYYPGFFSSSTTTTTTTTTKQQQQQQSGAANVVKIDPGPVHDTFRQNGWDTQWVARYGVTQPAHYHPETHECMAVLSGPGRIRFGSADLVSDWRKNTTTTTTTTTTTAEGVKEGEGEGEGVYYEKGGVEITVQAGDAFVIPAGVAHKSFDPVSGHEIGENAVFLTEGGHDLGNNNTNNKNNNNSRGRGSKDGSRKGDDDDDDGGGAKRAIREVEPKLAGFTMIGAYPAGKHWTWAEGGSHVGEFERMWAVEKPELDPLVGREGGLTALWK